MSEEKSTDDLTINGDFKEPNLPQGLVLYFHPKNFHSQKILFILYEKNIDFISYVLDLAHGEQFSAWFLSKNPKGDVPVLEDNGLVVPNSESIINYLEAKYKSIDRPSLIPPITSPEYTKSQYYEKVLNKLPVGALSLGSFIHEDLQLNPKPPFIGVIRQSCIENNDKVYEILKKSVNEVSDYRKTLLEAKLNLQERRKELIYSRVQFQKILLKFEEVLNLFERVLTDGATDREWLLSSEFYAVDISLGLLLHRLDSLGFENYFWTNGKLPKIEQYFTRFRQRPIFKKVVPSKVGMLTSMWLNTPSQYKLGAGVIGMAMFAAFAHK